MSIVILAIFRKGSLMNRQAWADTTALSGKPIHRSFCPTCGSALFSCPDSAPEVAFIKAGALDQIDEVVPKAEIVSREVSLRLENVTDQDLRPSSSSKNLSTELQGEPFRPDPDRAQRLILPPCDLLKERTLPARPSFSKV